MEGKNLLTLLEQMHSELENTPSVDQKGKDLLQELDKDIQDLLVRSGEKGDESQESTLERIGEAISYFEVTHPTITNTLSKIMESLSNSGI
ncbi:MAG: DUF4404 family protein [Chloroflexota bacterium]